MHISRLRVILFLIAGAAATLYGQSSPSNRPWPPDVQKVSPESPALSAQEALKTFYMPPGYRVELVASEPLVQDPIAIDWDPLGRLWAVEMPGFVPDLQAPEPDFDPIGKIVVLEDTNHDGRMDKRTVFADGLVLARSVKVLDAGVLVAEPPNVWLMKDTDGDLKMDKKELVTDQYGRREARVEQNANGFYWGLDNWMHTAESDVMLRFKDGKFEVKKTLARGEWGLTHDDAGRIYRNTNESVLHVDLVPTPYYTRNPNLLRTRGSYERLSDEQNLANVVWPVRPNPGTNRAYQLGIDREDGTLWHFTSVCAPMIYRGDRLPADTYGNAFVAEPAANLVSRVLIDDTGSSLRVRKAYDKGEFLASTDERFRPVWVSNAPDGTLYIVDMYRGVIQQRADITEYLRDHITKHELEKPTGLGRIYRVVHETTQRDIATSRPRYTTAQLVDLLSHPNGWWRDTAQRMLIERGDRSAAAAIATLATGAKDARTRAHALWTLEGLDALQPDVVVKALADPSRDVRISAIRLSEKWLAEANGPMQAAVLKRLDDTDWNVREQLAASLGALPAGQREPAIASVLERYASDAVALDAALSGARGGENAILQKLTSASEQSVQRETAITMLAATIVRSGQDDGIQAVLAAAADANRPQWQRAALLRGAEVALLGAVMPGTPARRGGGPLVPNAPCPTCPGGRAGPGGAYAFPQAPRPAPVTPRPTRLSKEPVAFTALAATTTDLGPRAAKVLEKLEWPGKPGASAPITPLTAEEQKRFEAGREIYRNICQACHQPDGRGQDRVAASLLGSPLALASPDIPARIVINGKEGSVGLMPPVGSTLSDEQIAAVLTYIRREWGQDGSPVDAATVAKTREMVAGRARPWKHDELMAMIGAQDKKNH